MKKTMFLLATMVLISCFAIKASAEENDLKIVCTNSILADFTLNLVKENVTIEYIMPSGVCPAYYDTSPSDVDKITDADIIISFGSLFMEPWLADLLEYNENYDLIECKDMGEWNIPSGAKLYIERLSEELSDIITEKNETIQTNSEAYLLEIDQTADILKNSIQTNGYADKKIISMSWQNDFLEWLGLNVTYSYGPPQGLSAQDQLEVINASSQNDICVIVDNLQSGTDFGGRVASESGASHVIFTNFPGAIPGTDTYIEMIEYNTEQLIKGMDTYYYKQGEINTLQGQISGLETQRNISIFVSVVFVILCLVLYMLYRKK
jgi:ABC-type Zn uptake system ZnuABC Zn-binding protein ZnuA